MAPFIPLQLIIVALTFGTELLKFWNSLPPETRNRIATDILDDADRRERLWLKITTGVEGFFNRLKA